VEDRELYELIKSDSEEGLYQLICKYKRFVWNITSKVLYGRYQDIEECVSDVFFRFWEHRHSLNINDGSIKGLLACMARNTAINYYKRIKKCQYVDIESECLVADNEIDSLIEDIYQKEIVDLILGELKETHKEIFIKRHIFMETIGEISGDMNLTEHQVRNILYQSKLKLKKLLARRRYNGAGFFGNGREM